MKGLINVSILVYLFVVVVIIACLSKIEYDTVVVQKVRVLEIKTSGTNGVLVIARYSADDGKIPLGCRVKSIEGVGSGVSCSFTGRIVELGNKPTDTSHCIGIYVEGMQHQEVLRNLVGMSRYENIEVDSGRQPLFKKVTGQLLWKTKFH